MKLRTSTGKCGDEVFIAADERLNIQLPVHVDLHVNLC